MHHACYISQSPSSYLQLKKGELLQEVLKRRNTFIRVIGIRNYFFHEVLSHLFANPFDQLTFFPKNTPGERPYLLYGFV